jgi:hypothetical protein
MNEQQLAHEEFKKSRISALEEKYKKLQQQLYSTLLSRNNFSPNKLSPEGVSVQLQSCLAASDLGALVDCLERMGSISRVDFVAQCVERLHHTVLAIEKP